jgi:hypothetical protein
MKIKGSQLEAGYQLTGHQGLSVWRITAVGTYVAHANAIKAEGGSRKVCLPGSSLRIADLTWEPTKDVDGRVVCWRRTVDGTPLVILNSTEEQMTKTTKEATPQAPEKVEPKAPKPIAFEPQKEARAVGQETKLGALLASLAQGATMEQLVEVLSKSGSPANPAVARSWLTYDVKRCGYGIRSEGPHLFLVFPAGMTEVAYKQPAEKKALEPTIKIVESEPKLKKAAGSSKKSKKAHAAAAK